VPLKCQVYTQQSAVKVGQSS